MAVAESTILKLLWPIVPGLAVGLVGYGMLRSDVNALNESQVKVSTQQTEDHDLAVRTDEKVLAIQSDLKDIRDAVKDIQREVTK
jgi:hypothetical protein